MLPLLLKKALADITAVLIRIKEEVSVLALECEAFAESGDDAICAESSERLILELSATRFTDFGLEPPHGEYVILRSAENNLVS